ncbi:MAG TPA: tripartite tricarboxylate transporter substrate-binding protein, partial [Burkholderiales bacterium]|nr:tripartite tricarboxylate transporter substrate-binding protein [Burkholderiales bacterium]
MLKITFIALAAALCIGSVSLPAQPLPKDYPNKPIRVVVPSPPGGPPDLIMRMIAPKMSMSMGQNLVIDNRAGAGGVVGTNF